jgi:quercetin dioxygenase-like cupin family protein
MTDTHTDHVHNETPANFASLDGQPFLIVSKEGDSYYPNEPAYYVGGDIYTVIADVQDTGGAFAYLDFYVPPHDVFPQHVHGLEAEAKYLLEGEVTFQFGGKDFTAPVGTFVYYPHGRPMGFTATDNPARMTVMAIPGLLTMRPLEYQLINTLMAFV